MSAVKLRRNTLTLLISSGGGAILSFALSVAIGRGLGEDGLGIYATALAWVFPLWIIAEFGLETLITREVAQEPETAPGYLRAASLARLGIGGTLMLLLILVAPLISTNPQLIRALQISAPLIVIGPLVSQFSAIFRARRVMWPVAALNLGMLLVQLGLTLLALTLGTDLLVVLAINVLTSLGQMVAAWGIYRLRFFTRIQHVVSLRVAGLLKRAAPFAIAAVLGAVQLRLSVILLEQMAGAAVTGQFAAASRFVEAGRMLPQALFVALFPALASLGEQSAAMLRRVLRWLLLYSLVFCIAMLLIGSLLIAWTYGPRFKAAGQLLPLLAWTLLPASLKGAYALSYYASGQEAAANRRIGLALLIQLVLSVGGITHLGTQGLVLALILSETIAFLLLWRTPNKS